MTACLLLAVIGGLMAAVSGEGIRDRFLRGLVLFGVALVVITESLGAFELIRKGPLAVCWIGVLAIALVTARPSTARRRGFRFATGGLKFDPVVGICSAGVVLILALTGLTAAFSPPNSADAMAYHMPRVVYWAEQASVRFFPTPYFNQIMLQPLAEYLMLHTYVLSSGDRLVNFGQWFASLASIVGVSSVARMFGAGKGGQAIAALFCATLPAGILASSGAKNDYWLAMWLVAAVYFALCFTQTGRGDRPPTTMVCPTAGAKSLRLGDALFLGASLGLALLTKATAYLFVPWPLAAIFLVRAGRVEKQAAFPTGQQSGKQNGEFGTPPTAVGKLKHAPPKSSRGEKELKRCGTGAVIAAAVALAINTPQYVRNYGLSRSVMGFESAQGDGLFRWRNETLGWKETASNMLRNLSDQLGARSDGWNQGVYAVVVDAHKRLGIDVNDPGTTWRWSTFAPPRNANHEADAPNRWHLVIILGVCFAVILRGILRGFHRAEWERPLYALALFCAFAAFCAYLKWQPFLARLLLPLFVLSAPLAGVTGATRRWFAPLGICLFLLSNARLPLLENWVRPLKGSKSVLHTPRSVQYFADMSQWNNQDSYRKAVDLIARSNCDTVGIDITNLQLEYPLQALLRERRAGARFIHTGVQNASTRYRQPIDAVPCAVVCLDCDGDSKRLAIYGDFGTRVTIDRFVIFLRGSHSVRSMGPCLVRGPHGRLSRCRDWPVEVRWLPPRRGSPFLEELLHIAFAMDHATMRNGLEGL